MSKVTTAQSNFTSGEWSPVALGRFDITKYANGAKKILNFLINQVGGVFYRPGTSYVAGTKYSSKAARLIPFQYSTTQAYIVELGDGYMRFYANQAQLTSGGSPVEVSTPYLEADIFNINYSQSADVMYLVHPDYEPHKLTRTSSVAFSLTKAPIVRGPFLDTNATLTTITPSSATGATTLTASANVFLATHSDSLWRVNTGVVRVTTISSATVAYGTVQAEPDGTAGTLTGTTAYTDWAEGAFSDYRGYPQAVTFHEQRLYYAGTPMSPSTFWGSNIRAFDNFDEGSAADDESVVFEIAANEVNAIKWLRSSPKALQIGTVGGTFSATAGTGNIITPDNISVLLDTNYGASVLPPKNIGGMLYYIQRNLNRLRELSYSFELDRQEATDMNLLADHILKDGSGAKDMAYQQAPNDRLWVVRNDGQIAVLTRNVQQEVMGWSRIQAGNDSRAAGVFETIAIIPQVNDEDQVWVICKRYINGGYKRYVEYFTDEDFNYSYEPVRLDSSLSRNTHVDITSATTTNPVVITKVSHGFAEATQIKIDNCIGMTELNGHFYKVSNASSNSFSLTSTSNALVNGTSYGTYVSGGEMRSMVTAVSGLDHLIGETVSVMVDGGVPADQQTYVVNTLGAVNLIRKAAVIHIGLPYNGDLQLLKFSDGSQTGTGQTKTRRIYLSTLRVFKSLGMSIGKTFSDMDRVFFGHVNDPLGEPPELVTGDVEKHFQTNWSAEDEICIRQDQPLPLAILSTIFRSELEER